MRMSLSFERQCYYAGLPEPVAEHRFAPPRRWRFDWAFPVFKLAVEVEGGAFLVGGGRHTRGSGFVKDLEKYAEAVILGWRVLRVTPQQVENGAALTLVSRAMGRSHTSPEAASRTAR